MKNRISSYSCPRGQETVSGLCYLAFQLLLLPVLLRLLNDKLAVPMRESELNFLYYMINFIAVLLILRDFLGRAVNQVMRHPVIFCESVILGLAGYFAAYYAIDWLIDLLAPGFSNHNNAAISVMNQESRILVLIGTVLLVPIAEESFFRGLIFRNLYGRSQWAAYVISTLAFALIHIAGYVTRYTPLEMVFAVLQYLPAGFFLAWSYTRADTVFASVAIHSLVNYITLTSWR